MKIASAAWCSFAMVTSLGEKQGGTVQPVKDDVFN
jgi:hypothetical protein